MICTCERWKPYVMGADVRWARCGSCWGFFGVEPAQGLVAGADGSRTEPVSVDEPLPPKGLNSGQLRALVRRQLGRGPWPCFWCGGPVYDRHLVVHHFDGNHENNDPRNLVPMHKDCHWSAHDAEERGVQRERHRQEAPA